MSVRSRLTWTVPWRKGEEAEQPPEGDHWTFAVRGMLRGHGGNEVELVASQRLANTKQGLEAKEPANEGVHADRLEHVVASLTRGCHIFRNTCIALRINGRSTSDVKHKEEHVKEIAASALALATSANSHGLRLCMRRQHSYGSF
jgi:hypothetical protein